MWRRGLYAGLFTATEGAGGAFAFALARRALPFNVALIALLAIVVALPQLAIEDLKGTP